MSANAKKQRSKGRSATADQALSDPRFAKMQTDAVYRLPSKKQTHVSVDPRFAHMLHDESFTSTAKVDRYGRSLTNKKQSRNLERLYSVDTPKQKHKQDLEDDEEAEEEPDEADEDEEEGGVSLTGDEDAERKLHRGQGDYNPARDGGYSQSSSSEEDTSDESELEGEDETGLAAQQVEDVPEGEISSRLAVVNLDWDNIRAVDLLAVLRSFAPRGEKIRKVTVYPSEFGKERLEREEVEGPPKELFQKKAAKGAQNDFEGLSDEDSSEEEDADSEDEDEDERIRRSLVKEDQGEDFDPDQLRQYQLERLRYYYAVVECSSENCATQIYRTVDGTEYLSTANFFDLRFIPAETDFSDDRPRDSCTELPEDYAPNEFTTDALQHSKVKLTWDADDVNRKEAQRKAFSRAEIDENDLKAYLASDTSDDDGPHPEVVDATLDKSENTQDSEPIPALSKEEIKRQKARQLLGLSTVETTRKARDEPVGDMQVTFTSALAGGGESVFENEPFKDETTRERYVRKEKERKARRKEKNKAARKGDAVEGDVELVETKDAEEDLGFDDPFFTEPASEQKAAKAARKEERRKRKAQLQAVQAAQSADLEQLLGEDQDGDASVIQHFDIGALKKAEKAANRKGKKGRLRASEKAALEAKAKDTFHTDVEDPRFKGIFEEPALALDPNNARFSQTEGMKKLLDAGRKKRARETNSVEAEEQMWGADKRKKLPANNVGEELSRLVKRVKGKET